MCGKTQAGAEVSHVAAVKEAEREALKAVRAGWNVLAGRSVEAYVLMSVVESE
jgi:hypothetical protein